MEYGRKEDKMGTYTKNLKLETPNYTDNADIPALAKKNNEIIDSEMIKRANGLDYDEQTGVLQLTGNNSKVGNPIQIKNNLPVTSMSSGTELKVNNYKQLIKFTKEGKTEQKSYTGKNILDYVSNLKASSDGLTSVINDDGSITTSGKPTSNYRTILNSINIIDFLEDGETYTFSQSKANDKLYMQMNAKKKDGTYSYYSLNDSTKSKQEIIVNKSIYETYTLNIQTGLTSDWGDSSLTITNKYMLCKGTDTANTSFEPYVGGQASPNPDYPQEIENIKGVENLFKPTLATTVLNGITCAANRDGTYTLNGTATADTTFTIGTDKNLIIDKTYKFLGCPNGGSSTTYRMSWNFHNYEYGNGLISKKTSEARNVQITIFKGITASNLIFKPMFTEDTLSTYNDYVPYGSNYLQLEDRTENLIGLDNKQYRVNLKKGDKIIAANNGTTNLNLNLYTNYGDTARNDFFTIAANSHRLIVIANDSHAIAWGGTLDNIAWVVKGEKFIQYEQYQEKIINVDLKGNNLCSDRDKTIRDELVIENGKAKINKKIKEIVLTGNESNWSMKEKDNDKLFQLKVNDIKLISSDTSEPPLLCNCLQILKPSVLWSENKTGITSLNDGCFIRIKFKDNPYASLDEFKVKLKSLYDSGNPIVVQYELAEPEVVDLGEVDFDLIENSTLTCEEESDMKIDYLTIDSNIFVQDSLDGNSSQKAPSIDAVNKAINKISNYSSEEQCIGEWFGEKHYRKVFEIDMDSTLKQMTIPTGIDMKQLTHAYGVALNSDTIYLPLNFYNNLGWDSFHLTGKGANIILQRGDNFSITKVFITLEYTKNV